MVLKPTRCYLFITALCTIFCISDARVDETILEEPLENILGNGSDQIAIRKTVERFIRTQIQDTITTDLTNNQLESDINKDIKETADKTMLQLAIDTKQIINKINLALIQTTTAGFIDKIEEQIVALQNENKIMGEEIQKLSNVAPQVPKVNDSCAINVPSSVKTRSDVWVNRETPKMDDLDIFMNNTRGCQYKAVRFYFENFYFPSHSFDGTTFETHFAIRMRSNAHIKVLFTSVGGDYSLDIGDNNNTKLTDHSTALLKTLKTQPTPGILSDDSYVEFYIKIDSDTLSFGKICEKPIITHNITTRKGDKVQIVFESYSVLGGKLLHGCPAKSV